MAGHGYSDLRDCWPHDVMALTICPFQQNEKTHVAFVAGPNMNAGSGANGSLTHASRIHAQVEARAVPRASSDPITWTLEAVAIRLEAIAIRYLML